MKEDMNEKATAKNNNEESIGSIGNLSYRVS